ncbi:MAG: protein kinase, partial [Roseimicrobium sp.]
EAYAMATLTHPNVVQVYDCGDAGEEFLFISMELVEGGDLSHAMRSGLVTPESALQLFIPICEGVQAAHDHGLVHRDIKPANIFLTADTRPKVADFGLAKQFDVQSTLLTKTGLGMGTPDYAAPEQYEELTDLDHRADIYSLGVMFYQMLTGHLPRGAYKAPSVCGAVDARLDAVVEKAMQTDRAERYQHVEEMRLDVEHIISTWMAPPKPRFVVPAGVPTRTGRVPTHTGRVLTATGRVPTHTGRVLTATGRVPTHTGRVLTATGRVPIAPRVAALHPPHLPGHTGPVPAPHQGEDTTQVSPKKSGAVMFAGLLATAVFIGGGAYLILKNPRPAPGAQVESGSTPSSSSSSTAASTAQVENGTDATSLPPLPVRPVLQTLDLLALTDPVRDRTTVPGIMNKNEWAREGALLVYKSDGKSGKVVAPVAFECRDYEIELRAERLGGNGRLHLELPVAGARILPLLLNDPTRRILNEKDGVNWPRNTPMIHVTVRVVRGGGGLGDRVVIRDKIGGKTVLDWKGRLGQSGRSGEPHPEFPGPLVTSIFVKSDSYSVRIWRLNVFEGGARELRTGNDSRLRTPSEILAFGGHRYQAMADHFDWKVARTKAEEMGGRLVVIESREENDALKKAFDSRIPAGTGLWIGASTPQGSGELRWISGGAMGFTAWAKDEPNDRNGAVMMMRGPRSREVAWADSPFHGRGQTVVNRGFIVEWEDTGVAATPDMKLANASTAPAASASAPSSPAAPTPPPPPPSALADPRLAQLESGFKSRYDADVQKPFATSVATLNTGYLRALAVARTAAQKGGNLAELTAIAEEAAHTKAGRPPPPEDVVGTPESLVKLRATYRSAMAGNMAARDKAAVSLYDLYLKALDVYIAELTKANNVVRAKEVEVFRGEIASRKP